MPQARLPDIGHAYDAHRKKAIDNINNNHTACIGSLYALNSLLPEEYRIEINSEEYKKRLNLDSEAICSFCEQMTELHKLQIITQLLPLLPSIIMNDESEKVWLCPKCNKENKLANTRIIKKIPKEPYFLKIVPAPPLRKDGLMDRNTYNNKFEKWAWTFLNELEAQMAQFRDDNWERGGELKDNAEIDTSVEEEQIA